MGVWTHGRVALSSDGEVRTEYEDYAEPKRTIGWNFLVLATASRPAAWSAQEDLSLMNEGMGSLLHDDPNDSLSWEASHADLLDGIRKRKEIRRRSLDENIESSHGEHEIHQQSNRSEFTGSAAVIVGVVFLICLPLICILMGYLHEKEVLAQPGTSVRDEGETQEAQPDTGGTTQADDTIQPRGSERWLISDDEDSDLDARNATQSKDQKDQERLYEDLSHGLAEQLHGLPLNLPTGMGNTRRSSNASRSSENDLVEF